MIIIPHIKAIKKLDINSTNKSSVKKYAKYLTKYNETMFNHSINSFTADEVIEIIDNNGKGQLKKTDAKWFAPIFNLSEKESKFIAYKLFGKVVDNFSDLSSSEQKIYNNEIINLTRLFMDNMASNFNRQSLGINKGSDLVYFGVVENQRIYTGYDNKVKEKKVKQGTLKDGFNTHVHIILSRKANNIKKTLISPNVNNRKTSSINLKNKDGKIGFDRYNFISICEASFDRIYNYKRELSEKFSYLNEQKKSKRISQNKQSVIFKNKFDTKKSTTKKKL